MIGIDVKHIRIFLAVADQQSFTKAAEKLNIAQPWLSVQVRKLEESLGFPLFARNRKQTVELTRKARELLPAARELLLAHERLIAAAAAIGRTRGLSLLVGAPEYTIDVPERLEIIANLNACSPQIDVEIANANSLALLEQIRGREIDVAFALGPLPAEDLDQLVVRRYGASLLLPQESPLASLPEIPVADLHGLTVANFHRRLHPPLFDHLAAALERRGVHLANFPEPSARGAGYYARVTRTPVIVSSWFRGTPETLLDMVVRPITDPTLYVDLLLLRRHNDCRPAVAAIWDCARTLADQKQATAFLQAGPPMSHGG